MAQFVDLKPTEPFKSFSGMAQLEHAKFAAMVMATQLYERWQQAGPDVAKEGYQMLALGGALVAFVMSTSRMDNVGGMNHLEAFTKEVQRQAPYIVCGVWANLLCTSLPVNSQEKNEAFVAAMTRELDEAVDLHVEAWMRMGPVDGIQHERFLLALREICGTWPVFSPVVKVIGQFALACLRGSKEKAENAFARRSQ